MVQLRDKEGMADTWDTTLKWLMSKVWFSGILQWSQTNSRSPNHLHTPLHPNTPSIPLEELPICHSDLGPSLPFGLCCQTKTACLLASCFPTTPRHLPRQQKQALLHHRKTTTINAHPHQHHIYTDIHNCITTQSGTHSSLRGGIQGDKALSVGTWSNFLFRFIFISCKRKF